MALKEIVKDSIALITILTVGGYFGYKSADYFGNFLTNKTYANNFQEIIDTENMLRKQFPSHKIEHTYNDEPITRKDLESSKDLFNELAAENLEASLFSLLFLIGCGYTAKSFISKKVKKLMHEKRKEYVLESIKDIRTDLARIF